MRKPRSRKITLLLGACFSALLMLIAAGVAPAFSDDAADSANGQPTAEAAADEGVADAAERHDKTTRDGTAERLRDLQSDGYEWSATRTAADRYLWSHRPR